MFTSQQIKDAIEAQPTMKVEIRVWGNFGADARTPIVAEQTIELPNGHYAEAEQATRSLLRSTFGKTAHYQADGWHGTYNSRFVGR